MFILCLFFDCFIHFSFYFFQKQKDNEDEQKNETQQRIIDPLVFQYLWNLMIKINFPFFISFYHFINITYIVYYLLSSCSWWWDKPWISHQKQWFIHVVFVSIFRSFFLLFFEHIKLKIKNVINELNYLLNYFHKIISINESIFP